MKTIKFLTAMTAIVFAVLFVGCAGKDGAPGATGPQGATGNANVTSNIFTVNSAGWIDNGHGIYYNTEPDNQIENASVDNISVYVSTDQITWFDIPSPGLMINGVNIAALNYGYSTSSVTFNEDSAIAPAPSNTLFFKVVAIPPVIMKRHPNTNWKNAAEVAQLPEVKAVLNNKQ